MRVVSLAGFEPTTLRLGIIRSIQLSYKDNKKARNLQPTIY